MGRGDAGEERKNDYTWLVKVVNKNKDTKVWLFYKFSEFKKLQLKVF